MIFVAPLLGICVILACKLQLSRGLVVLRSEQAVSTTYC